MQIHVEAQTGPSAGPLLAHMFETRGLIKGIFSLYKKVVSSNKPLELRSEYKDTHKFSIYTFKLTSKCVY